MKIVKREEITPVIEHLKAAGRTVVFTNGCFDILHAGHVRYLTAARQLGDCLIVGLNSDCSVQALKGPTRPINSEEDRAEVIAGLTAVDFIILFNEQTAETIVSVIKPDIYVKGGDYSVDQLPEASVINQYGGKIIIIPEVPGRSSTNIIQKISRQESTCNE